MKAFDYNNEYNVLTSEIATDESPLEPGVFLVPAKATLIAPPKAGPNKCAIFDESKQKWSLIEDHRGKESFSTNDTHCETVNYPGPIKKGFTLKNPNGPFKKFASGKWVDDIESINANEKIWAVEQLKATDVYMLSDYPITTKVKYLIKDYRKSLRIYIDQSKLGVKMVATRPEMPDIKG